MARKTLPDDPPDLRFLLDQVMKFLDHAQAHYSKQRMQELMIRQALHDPRSLVENASFAAAIREEVARTFAALVIPSKFLSAYLDEAVADIAEDHGPAPTIDLSPESTEEYGRLNGVVRAIGEVVDSYDRLAGEILAKLAAIEAADRDALPKLRVDRANGLVVFGEIGYSVGEVVAAIFQALIDAQGKRVSTGDMQANDPFLESVNVSRTLKKLPRILGELVDPRPGKGFRLRTELLS